VLAGGCYRFLQELLRHRDRVISTRVGWTGGENYNPTEEDNRGHAEAVEVVFDPERLPTVTCSSSFSSSTEQTWTNTSSAPATAPRSSARAKSSAAAEETIRDVDAAGHWPGKIVTVIFSDRLRVALPL
jgi:peptide-methionine (S)-S-oxide reductase